MDLLFWLFLVTTQEQLKKLISTTEPVVYSLCYFKYFVNVLSMPSSMHHQWIHQCIHQCIINAPSTHSSMYHQCIHYCIYQCILNAPSIHHQCIHCIKCINFVHSVLPFIISTSSVRLSMHHQCINQCINQCIINAIHQCIINPSIMLLKLINNSLRKYKGN